MTPVILSAYLIRARYGAPSRRNLVGWELPTHWYVEAASAPRFDA